MDGRRLVREPEEMQSAVQPISRTISGENAAGPIAAMGCRGQTDDHEARIDRAEAWYGTAPVFPIAKAADFIARYGFPILYESRTPPAIDNLTLGRQQCHSE